MEEGRDARRVGEEDGHEPTTATILSPSATAARHTSAPSLSLVLSLLWPLTAAGCRASSVLPVATPAACRIPRPLLRAPGPRVLGRRRSLPWAAAPHPKTRRRSELVLGRLAAATPTAWGAPTASLWPPGLRHLAAPRLARAGLAGRSGCLGCAGLAEPRLSKFVLGKLDATALAAWSAPAASLRPSGLRRRAARCLTRAGLAGCSGLVGSRHSELAMGRLAAAALAAPRRT